MVLDTLTAECNAYNIKVLLEEKKTNSWLKSSGLTRICNETEALDGYKNELKPVFKSTPTQSQAIIYAAVYTQNVGDFVGEPTHHRT
jgi:predicted component of type VI protein secretion system